MPRQRKLLRISSAICAALAVAIGVTSVFSGSPTQARAAVTVHYSSSTASFNQIIESHRAVRITQTEPAAQPMFPFTYTVKPGDYLTKISTAVYGNQNEWTRIWAANKGKISNPWLILAGWQLVIPAPTGPVPPGPATTTSAVVTAQTAARSVPSGSLQSYAEGLVGAAQFACLQPLWMRESGWNVYASNSGSGAYGIPQALPGSKMASAGSDWRTNGRTQIRWGVGYINGRYGSSCAAWAHEQATGWY